jgi:cellulose synthase (UDP-forming)
MALLNPSLGKFNVTDKGLKVTRRMFDWSSVQVLLITGILSVLSLGMVPYWLITGLQGADAVLINAVWCVVNILLLLAAILVALEQPQLRDAHRLNRRLTATIYAGAETLTGTTLNISETGTQLILENWPNLPDLIDIEILGDYGARVFLSGRVIRVSPRSDREVEVAVAFEKVTPFQWDALVLVLYSDVKEWYSQARSVADRPLASIRFLATTLFRSFRPLQPSQPAEVRKCIQADTQVYIEGQYFSAIAQEISSQSLQLVLNPAVLLDLHPEIAGQGQPVGLVISTPSGDTKRLVAQIEHLDRSQPSPTLELSFPQVLHSRQGHRIKALLYAAGNPPA